MAIITAPILGSRLRLAVLRLHRRLRQESDGQISSSQLSALSVVVKRGPLSLGELAMIERIAPPSLTRVVSVLEDLGLLERRVDASDRRVTRVVATTSGIAVVAETQRRRDAFLTAGLLRLTPEERSILARAVPLLEQLASGEHS